MGSIGFALSLTLLAGMATSLGGALALLIRRPTPSILAVALGFSAGVMLYVSFVELFAQSQAAFARDLGSAGAWAAPASFFGGVAVAAIIDKLVPEPVNPHEAPGAASPSMLRRLGLLTALVLGLHNLPEGFATFMTAIQAPSIALPIAVAIGIHNIPEGIAVAVPLYYATRSRRRALGMATLAGLTEPVGGLLMYLVLRPFASNSLLGAVLGLVAGIMVFISLDELLPTAERYGRHHLAIYGLVAGMAVMAGSLLLLR